MTFALLFLLIVPVAIALNQLVIPGVSRDPVYNFSEYSVDTSGYTVAPVLRNVINAYFTSDDICTVTNGLCAGSSNFTAETCEAGNYSWYNGTGFECSPDLQGTGGAGTLTGSGTQYYIPMWNDTNGTSLNNSVIQQVNQVVIVELQNGSVTIDTINNVVNISVGNMIIFINTSDIYIGDMTLI